jgi:nitroimidazol reductase NimA-like FMN-containing flavoprotein (pyridoxamine 5'-phosphate oxidase superfamily)
MHLVSGPWDEPTVRRWLAGARIPVRLAVLAPRGPLVVSLWYRLEGDALWCATAASADVVARVTADPRVGFEVAPDVPPYRGVRGTGHAEVVADRGRTTLEALLDRYLDADNAALADWLRRRADTEVAIRIGDLRVASWDFSGRMQPQEPGPILPAVAPRPVRGPVAEEDR